MNPDLQDFLEARDLDLLAEAHDRLPVLEPEDVAAIRAVLRRWYEPQAIANLLMHPQLIPEAERAAAVVRGLNDTQCQYLTLAAIVGLGEFEVEALPSGQRAAVVDRVLALAAADRGVIADRASAFLAERLWHFGNSDPALMVALLDHPSEVVQHNALVGLIPLLGLDHLDDALTRAVREGRLSVRSREAAARKLAKVQGFSAEDPDDGSKEDLGSLAAPLLAYVPNLDSWTP